MTNSAEFTPFYDPDLYEIRVGPGRRVAALYAELAREFGGPVLELGCGVGEVVMAIAAVGVAATGVDGAPRMLERARQRLAEKPVELRALAEFVQGMIETFEPAGDFRQVFFSNDIVAHFFDDAELASIISRYRSRLRSEGRLVIDISDFDYSYMGRYCQPLHHIPRLWGHVPWNGGTIACWETTIVAPDTGLLTARFRYEFLAGNGALIKVINRELQIYPRRAQEVRMILRAAGFASIREMRHSDPSGDFLLYLAHG